MLLLTQLARCEMHNAMEAMKEVGQCSLCAPSKYECFKSLEGTLARFPFGKNNFRMLTVQSDRWTFLSVYGYTAWSLFWSWTQSSVFILYRKVWFNETISSFTSRNKKIVRRLCLCACLCFFEEESVCVGLKFSGLARRLWCVENLGVLSLSFLLASSELQLTAFLSVLLTWFHFHPLCRLLP